MQRDHVHLIAEADSNEALRSGAQGIAIRLARTVNRIFGGRGECGADVTVVVISGCRSGPQRRRVRPLREMRWKAHTGFSIEPVIASDGAIRAAIERYYGAET